MGCIRVPGSVNKRGHQKLVAPFRRIRNAATLQRCNASTAVDRRHQALEPDLRRNREEQARRARVVVNPPRTIGSSPRPIVERARLEGGSRSCGGSPRLASMTPPPPRRLGAPDCGAEPPRCPRMDLPRVRGELTGQFPGLAALHQSRSQLGRLLEREWAKAIEFTASGTAKKAASKSNTSHTKPSGGAKASPASIHQLVNELENVLYAVLDARPHSRVRVHRAEVPPPGGAGVHEDHGDQLARRWLPHVRPCPGPAPRHRRP